MMLHQLIMNLYLSPSSPSKLNPSSSPNVKEDQINFVVPDTPEDVIASRAKTTLKNVFDVCKAVLIFVF